MNIALFTPSLNPYTETFIQAHKNLLKGQVLYYYGPLNQIKLDNHNGLISKRAWFKLRLLRKLTKGKFTSLKEKVVLTSLQVHQIDVILVEYGTHAYNLLPVLKVTSIPFVVHFHGYDASVKGVIKSCNYYKELFKYANKVIVVSKAMEEQMLKLGCPKDKLTYNVYGPQHEFEEVQPSFSKKQFIAIGRFTDKKAPYYTILAFSKVVGKHPDAKLLMAGDGKLLYTCKNLVQHLELEDKVEFLGVITPDQYREYLSESLAFVQHSITAENGDMEGTPLAVLEASVAGLPVIATKHAGIPDVIVHGKTGLLCDEHDVNAMSQHMLTVLDDIGFAKTLGAAGKQHVLKHFSMAHHIEKLNTILEQAKNS